MPETKGRSPRGHAPRTLTVTHVGSTVEILITPDVNPNGGWAIELQVTDWRALLAECAAAGVGMPSPVSLGAEHGQLTSAQASALDALRARVKNLILRAPPETRTLAEALSRENYQIWTVLAEELRASGWTVELGELHPLYGEGTVAIRRP